MDRTQKKKAAVTNLFNYLKDYKDNISKDIDSLKQQINDMNIRKKETFTKNSISFRIPLTNYGIAKNKETKYYVICKRVTTINNTDIYEEL